MKRTNKARSNTRNWATSRNWRLRPMHWQYGKPLYHKFFNESRRNKRNQLKTFQALEVRRVLYQRERGETLRRWPKVLQLSPWEARLWGNRHIPLSVQEVRVGKASKIMRCSNCDLFEVVGRGCLSVVCGMCMCHSAGVARNQRKVSLMTPEEKALMRRHRRRRRKRGKGIYPKRLKVRTLKKRNA